MDAGAVQPPHPMSLLDFLEKSWQDACGHSWGMEVVVLWIGVIN